jgi:hypothetical protein
MSVAQLARSPGFRFNAVMRGGTVLVILGIAGLWAYSVGRQNVPASNSPSAKTNLSDKTVRADTKRKVEVALTAAAIAAIIVQASRAQYHAGGRPCACPDDTMRNGRACGGRSAYCPRCRMRTGRLRKSPDCYPQTRSTICGFVVLERRLDGSVLELE